ncbi:MAG: DNA methyltransferase [bacterium]
MQYFFTLGNNPTLSVAEISAVFGMSGKILDTVYIIETENKINAKDSIKKMGGVIKIGKIESKTSAENKNEIIKEVIKLLDPKNGKFKFGFSYYGHKKFNFKSIAMEVKKYLRENNISCRWVISKEKTLSSVVVEQNKLTSSGAEIVLIEDGYKLLIGKTSAVQPFKELSKRDYGRPARDDRSGMLPPKLAQIMINLSGADLKNKILLDPFCGSGTILTEALLAGFENLIGSDISEKAISDTKKNIEWIKQNSDTTNLKKIHLQLFNINATEISRKLKPNSVDIIVTEPYLGQQRGKVDLQKQIKELEILYSRALKEFKKIIKNNGRIAIIFPVFFNKYFINPDLNGFKIINSVPDSLLNSKNIVLTARNTIVYGRPRQKVWREIVLMQ